MLSLKININYNYNEIERLEGLVLKLRDCICLI